MTHTEHIVRQGSWRWYSDATPDTSMTALAAENTVPTLSQSDIESGIIRLRVQINEIGGADGAATAIQLQYGDGTNWQDIEGQTPANGNEGWWIRWAAGAATSGNTISNQLLTSTTASGIYHESASQNETVLANAVHEIDIAIRLLWPPPNETIRFRLTYGGVALALDSGETEIQVTTPSAANRSHAITRLEPDPGNNGSDEMRFSSWPRFFYDGTRWWFYTVLFGTPQEIVFYSWDGPGNSWVERSTFDMGVDVTGSQVNATFKDISGTPTIFVLANNSSTTRRFTKGTISGTSITWEDTSGSPSSLSQASDEQTHCAFDDGNFIWMAGMNSGLTGVWVRRSTNANDDSSWNAEISISDSGVASRDLVACVGLESDKCLVMWINATDPDLKYSIVTSSGAGAVGTVNATAASHQEDWGWTRSNGYVYVVHKDADTAGANWVLRVFDESTETWSTGTSPSISGQISADDGIAVVADGDDIYAFGTFEGSEGNQDRRVEYKKYVGPGDSGTWDVSRTELTPTEPRGNGDLVCTSIVSGGGLIVVGFSFNDDGTTLTNNGFTAEYHYIAVSNAHNLSSHITSDVLVSDGVQVTEQLASAFVGDVLVGDGVQVKASLSSSVAGDVLVSDGVWGAKELTSAVTGDALANDGVLVTAVLNSDVLADATVSDGVSLTQQLSSSQIAEITVNDGIAITGSLASSVSADVQASDGVHVTESISSFVVADVLVADGVSAAKELISSFTGDVFVNDGVDVVALLISAETGDVLAADGIEVIEQLTSAIMADVLTNDGIDIVESLSSSASADVLANDGVSVGNADEMTSHVTGDVLVFDGISVTKALSSNVTSEALVADGIAIAAHLSTHVVADTIVADGIEIAAHLASDVVADVQVSDGIAIVEAISSHITANCLADDGVGAATDLSSSAVANVLVSDGVDTSNLSGLVSFITSDVLVADGVGVTELLSFSIEGDSLVNDGVTVVREFTVSLTGDVVAIDGVQSSHEIQASIVADILAIDGAIITSELSSNAVADTFSDDGIETGDASVLISSITSNVLVSDGVSLTETLTLSIVANTLVLDGAKAGTVVTVVEYHGILTRFCLYAGTLGNYTLYKGNLEQFDEEVNMITKLIKGQTLAPKFTLTIGDDHEGSYVEPDTVTITVYWNNGESSDVFSTDDIDNPVILTSTEGVYYMATPALIEGSVVVVAVAEWDSPAWVVVKHKEYEVVGQTEV